MVKYCTFCGKEIKEGAKFCQQCGKKLKPEATEKTEINKPIQQTQSPATPQPSQQTPPQMTPQPTSTPMQPKKSKKGLIIGLVAVVAVVVVLLIVVLILFGGGITGGNESDFYGTWESNVAGIWTYEMVFNSDKTLEYGLSGYTAEIGTWSVNNEKLVFTINMIGSEFSSGEYNYEFSDGGNTLTLKIGNVDNWVFTKK